MADMQSQTCTTGGKAKINVLKLDKDTDAYATADEGKVRWARMLGKKRT